VARAQQLLGIGLGYRLRRGQRRVEAAELEESVGPVEQGIEMIGGQAKRLVERRQRRHRVLELQQRGPLQPAQVGGQQVVPLAPRLLRPLARQRERPFGVPGLQRRGGGVEARIGGLGVVGHDGGLGAGSGRYRSRAGGRSREAM